MKFVTGTRDKKISKIASTMLVDMVGSVWDFN